MKLLGKGKIIWFYGVSRVGKTTLADMLAKEMSKIYKIERLDGDVVRKYLCRDLGFTKKDVSENIRRVGHIADILTKQKFITVIASFITPFLVNRMFLKKLLGDRLILISVECDVKTLIKRDTKGLYEMAIDGEIDDFAGITYQFEKDPSIDIIRIHTDFDTPEESLKKILEKIRGIN